MPCRSVLVVEDEDDIRRSLAQALEAEGYRVLAAENGVEALEVLRNLPPEEIPGCMLLDLSMPEMDGETLLGVMREESVAAWGTMKIIVATARGNLVEPSPILRGVQRIRKPFDIDELFSAVAEHCGAP